MLKQGRLFFRALLSFLALPGLFAFVLPPLIVYLDPWKRTPWPPGLIAASAGIVILLWCVRDFYVIGKGTLAPWDPPKKLVVIGLYRYTRNPMYVGVLLLVLGWSLYFLSPLMALYLLVMAIAFHVRTIFGEEPWLKETYGAKWDQYQSQVPRWIPRLHVRKN